LLKNTSDDFSSVELCHVVRKLHHLPCLRLFWSVVAEQGVLALELVAPGADEALVRLSLN